MLIAPCRDPTVVQGLPHGTVWLVLVEAIGEAARLERRKFRETLHQLPRRQGPQLEVSHAWRIQQCAITRQRMPAGMGGGVSSSPQGIGERTYPVGSSRDQGVGQR